MLLFLVVLFVCSQSVCISADANNYTNYDDEYGQTWMYFPDGIGNPQRISLIPEQRGRLFGSSEEYVKPNVHFVIFSSGKNSREPKEIDMGTHEESNYADLSKEFNPNWPTKIIIHGWQSSMKSFPLQMKDAYLARGKYNVIAVNWPEVAASKNYLRSATDTKIVGQLTAEMIDYLHTEHKADYDQIHIIGHSLGAHVAGYAGSHTKFGNVSRITGLDPAKPFFYFSSEDDRLDKSDGQFVDVIHTSSLYISFLQPVGHIDFYPNTGYPPQPGCSLNPFELADACSHARAHEFFLESISESGFYGYECDSRSSFNQGKCTTNPVIMGEDTPHDAHGTYYLKTNSESPFGMGNYAQSD